MPGTGSSDARTQSEKVSHAESHTSMSEPKSRGMSHVDASAASPQVRKSRSAGEKVTPPLPREVTFSALSLERAERDPRGGIDQQNPPRGDDPEPVGPIAEQFLEDLAARQAEALNRLRRQATTRTKDQP